MQQRQLSVMHSAKQNHSQKGSQQSEPHIRLRIPDIPLSPQKRIRVLSGSESHPPLYQLIKRAESQREGYCEKCLPESTVDDIPANN
jgi:hypothetical protein